MIESSTEKIRTLLEKGVTIPNPGSIDIGAEVDPGRISGNGVTLYPGCRIYGSSTLILKGADIGYEAPVTIENCHIGPNVSLKGGFFSGAVFLAGAGCGSGAHVRAGTIFEEQARCAHTVGLKQTLLFPYVTLGSLINFCDVLMSGGTTAKNHSEVGSSYIHFNYTPNQDKATASLLGDVPRGVMLDRNPIFLGGQGGLVGPCILEFGTTVSAGSICRKDEKNPGRLIIEGTAHSGRVPFSPGIYRGVKRIVFNNINYIANLLALRQWYLQVRSLFISEHYPDDLARGLVANLEGVINERIKQFKTFCLKMPASIEMMTANSASSQQILIVSSQGSSIHQQKELYDQCTEVEACLQNSWKFDGQTDSMDRFLETVHSAIGISDKSYLTVIKGLSESSRQTGTHWLQSIVDQVSAAVFEIIPLLKK